MFFFNHHISVRCGPPSEVTFSRLSGGLLVDVSWPREDAKAIGKFSVSYKAPGSRSWSEVRTKRSSLLLRPSAVMRRAGLEQTEMWPLLRCL